MQRKVYIFPYLFIFFLSVSALGDKRSDSYSNSVNTLFSRILKLDSVLCKVILPFADSFYISPSVGIHLSRKTKAGIFDCGIKIQELDTNKVYVLLTIEKIEEDTNNLEMHLILDKPGFPLIYKYFSLLKWSTTIRIIGEITDKRVSYLDRDHAASRREFAALMGLDILQTDSTRSVATKKKRKSFFIFTEILTTIKKTDIPEMSKLRGDIIYHTMEKLDSLFKDYSWNLKNEIVKIGVTVHIDEKMKIKTKFPNVWNFDEKLKRDLEDYFSTMPLDYLPFGGIIIHLHYMEKIPHDE